MMKKIKKLMSLALALCMVLSLMPTTMKGGEAPPSLTVGIGGNYSTLTEAIGEAGDGDTITLNSDINETVIYETTADKTITIDGQGHQVTGADVTNYPFALMMGGTGAVILKNLTLKGSDVVLNLQSAGLYVFSNVNVLCEGSVTAIGGSSLLRESSGVVHIGTGVVNITNAIGGINSLESYGAQNNGGTLNVTNATGSAATNISYGVTNDAGILNVTNAISGEATIMSRGVWNSTGTVNVTYAEGGATGEEGQGVFNNGIGKVNAGTVIGGTVGVVNTDVAQLTLKKGTDADCVLDFITIAETGDTNVGVLPNVIKNGTLGVWYTNGSRSTLFADTKVTGATKLYSTFVDHLTVGTNGDYSTVADALLDASDGDTITLLNDIIESVVYTVSADKTITIDGDGFILTGDDTTGTAVLALSGAGIINLKDITLLFLPDELIDDNYGLLMEAGSSASVRSIGLVSAYAGAGKIRSYGVRNMGSGDVYITNAVGGICTNSRGVSNEDEGTVNVVTARSGEGIWSYGVYNDGAGIVNVNEAIGGYMATTSIGAENAGSGTVNVNSAMGGNEALSSSIGVDNGGTGTVNVNTAIGGSAPYSVGGYNASGGTLNVNTATGGYGISSFGIDIYYDDAIVNVATATCDETSNTHANIVDYAEVNTGANVTTLTLYKGAGADCVLDSITVAKTGPTNVGTLPSVIKNGVAGVWYTDSAKTVEFSGTTVTDITALYSNLSNTVTFDENGGDTQANPTTRTALFNGTVGSLPTHPVKVGYTFKGWNTLESGSGTAFTATTVVSTDITVYAKWALNSNSSGGSSGGAVPIDVPTPPITEILPTSNSDGAITGTTSTDAKSDSNGKAAATVTEGQLLEAVKQAIDAADKKGDDTLAKVEIKVTAPVGASSVETSIPQAAFKAVVDSSISALTVSTPIAALTFDKEALSTISTEATGDIKMTASKVEPSTLSDEIKQEIGDRPVFNFSVTSGNTTISEFGGNVTVAVPYTPKEGEALDSIVIYYINAKGELETVSHCAYDPMTGSITFTTNHFSIYAVGYNKVNFTDVATNAWYKKAVEFVAARGITTGTSAGIFSPESQLTRGQFLVMAMKAYGIQPDQNPKDNFVDAGNTYYTGYLAAAKRMGITSGIGNNHYAPNAQISRQEMFTLLYKTLKLVGELPTATTGKALTDFSDVNNVEPWAKDAMALFVKTDVIGGNGDKLSPMDSTNRAEMAQVLYNLLSK